MIVLSLVPVAVGALLFLLERSWAREQAFAVSFRPAVLRALSSGALYAPQILERLGLDDSAFHAFALYGLLRALQRDGLVTWVWHDRDPRYESRRWSGSVRRRASYRLTGDGHDAVGA